MDDPKLTVDYISVMLLILMGVPWALPLLQHLELPGGIKMDFKAQIDAIQKLAEEQGIIESEPIQADSIGQGLLSYELLLKEDPNLALAAVRLDLERELRAAGSNEEHIRYTGIGRILDLLRAKQQISHGEYTLIKDILPLLNQGVHGLPIDTMSAERVISIGKNLINNLKVTLESDG